MSGVVAGQVDPGKIGTVVVDLDGVVYLDTHGVPGAADALTALRSAGLRLLFATNNSTKTPSSAARHIAERTGFAADPEEVVTSSMAAAAMLAGTADRAFVVGAPAIAEALEGVGIATVVDWRLADVVVAGLHTTLSYDDLASATLAIRNGARLVATNTDATYPTPQGLLPGGGAIVAALERAGDVSAVVAGKPHAPMRSLIEARALGGILMVGDRPETDIALAGDDWSSVLVLTGVTASAAEIDPRYRPSAIVRSIADVPGLLRLDRSDPGDGV